MKNYLTTLVLLTLTFAAVHNSAATYSKDVKTFSGHDTLLFDGGFTNSIPAGIADGCNIRVTFVEGEVTGPHEEYNVIMTCNQPDSVPVQKDGPLKLGHKVIMGSSIKTGSRGRVELSCPDGSTIRIGPNSDFKLDDCEFGQSESRMSIKFVLGSVWATIMHAAGTNVNVDLETERAHTGVRGTVFSQEVKNEGGILVRTLKVYEGSIEFKNENPAGSPEAQIQLQKDLEDGKITMDEYNKRAAEMSKKIVSEDPIYRITVNAGFQSTIRGTEPPTPPVPITGDDDAWYLDKNFKSR